MNVIELDPLTFGAEQRCFGCGPNHQPGLRMRFTVEGDAVLTRFVPSHDHEGPPGIFHGGLQATLADELAAWTLIGLRQRMGLTVGIDVRLIRPARVGIELVGRGTIRSEKPEVAVIDTLFTQDGKATLTGSVSYVIPTVAQAENTLGRAIPEAWRKFLRPS